MGILFFIPENPRQYLNHNFRGTLPGNKPRPIVPNRWLPGYLLSSFYNRALRKYFYSAPGTGRTASSVKCFPGLMKTDFRQHAGTCARDPGCGYSRLISSGMLIFAGKSPLPAGSLRWGQYASLRFISVPGRQHLKLTVKGSFMA